MSKIKTCATCIHLESNLKRSPCNECFGKKDLPKWDGECITCKHRTPNGPKYCHHQEDNPDDGFNCAHGDKYELSNEYK